MNPNHESASQRYTLNCRMNQEAAALERLCRVVRVRGFRISRMAMESTGDTLDIALTLEGSRPVAMLQSQLEKLHTVAGVELVSDTMARSRSA
ncbi:MULTISPECIES: ACT domain-containing protein [Marinobacter]|jgi:acetolactate synthase II small subunit|uniref:ACT domain-containing protein n=1 Tax=Marinobacter TaxID=2742 RepID=UPI00241C50B6|nr:ACT domain-containing protein [Marinobacter nauticus]|tara:strand:+ start:135 stop:413 length:279 start_codon:yes stop_codon:yes gene_type:complete